MYTYCAECDVFAFVNEPFKITLKNINHFLDEFPCDSLTVYKCNLDPKKRKKYDQLGKSFCPAHYGVTKTDFMPFVPHCEQIDEFNKCIHGKIVPDWEACGDKIEEIVIDNILKPYCIKNNYPFLRRFNWSNPCGKSCDACKNPCKDLTRGDQIHGYHVPYLWKKRGFLYLPKKYIGYVDENNINIRFKGNKRNLTGGRCWDEWLSSASFKFNSRYEDRYNPGKCFYTGYVDFVFRDGQKSIIIDITNSRRYEQILRKVQKGYSAFCDEFWIFLTNKRFKFPKRSNRTFPKNVRLFHLHSSEVIKMFNSICNDYNKIIRELDSHNWQ